MTVLYTVDLLNTAVYRPAVLIFYKLSLSHSLFHFVHYVFWYAFFMTCFAPIYLALYRIGDFACFTKFTYYIINIYGKENRWEHCIDVRTVGCLQKLSTIDDVTKYHGIPVSRYFLRRYIIVGHFLIPRIPTRNPLKFAGVPQTRQQISAARLKFPILWGHVGETLLFNKFFPNCRYVP